MTAAEVGTLLTQKRAAEKLPRYSLHADLIVAIAGYLKRRGIPYAEAHYEAGICLTCGREVYVCPGVHTFEEIQEAGRAQAKEAAHV